MQRNLTYYLACSGLLVHLVLGVAPAASAQDSDTRHPRTDTENVKRDADKKSTISGLWSNTSKWRQRLFPFSSDKEDTKNSASKRGRQAAVNSNRRAGQKNGPSVAKKRLSGRNETTRKVDQRGISPEASRGLVTMPAMSGPPDTSQHRGGTSTNSPRATTVSQGRPPTTPVRDLDRGKPQTPQTDTATAVVSKSFVPASQKRGPVATADLRDGKSSRRKNRFTRVDSDPAEEVSDSDKSANEGPIQRPETSPAKPIGPRVQAASPPRRIAPETTLPGEVRASDRQANTQSGGSNRKRIDRAVLPATVARGERATGERANQKGRSTSKIAGAGTSNNPMRRSVAGGRAPRSRNDAPTREGSQVTTRVNPLSGRSTERPEARALRASKNFAETRTERVSARLTSQTVGGELGDSLLFARSPQLSVETLGPSEVVIGKEATFKIRLRNLGDPVAESVLVRINTPLGAQIVAAQPSRGQTNAVAAAKQKPLEWRLERLDAHETEFLTLRIVPRKSDAFDLGVTWTLAPIASQARIKVQEPKLNLEIIGPHEIDYGDTKIYRLTITNPGNGVADNVQLKLKPLDGSSRPMAVREVGSLEPGGKQIMEVELTARQNGYLNVEAIAVADTDLEAAARQRVLVRRAQLVVDAKGPEMNYAGTTAIYRFQVDNEGNSSAENIRVVATLPTGGEYLESSDEGEWNPESRQVIWNVPALVAQNNQSFEVRVSLSHPGENLFGVRLSADDDLAASSEVKTLVEALADLQLVINDPRGPVPVDEETTYEVLISNRGTKAAEMVDVVVFFSEGIEPISVAGGGAKVNTGQVVFHPIEQIAPGEDVVYKIAARANRSGNHVFRTEVACEEADVRLVAEESTRFY